jgi:hypothetical protein
MFNASYAHDEFKAVYVSANPKINLAEVYTINERRSLDMEITSRDSTGAKKADTLRRAPIPEDTFGGPVEDCSNEVYHCLMQGYYFIFPKKNQMQSWRYLGVKCEIFIENKKGYRVAKCQYERHTRIVFAFSEKRGILAYCAENVPGAWNCNNNVFKLVSPKGLLYSDRH